jgi:hypothetical protein
MPRSPRRWVVLLEFCGQHRQMHVVLQCLCA